jgi:hypothetical protein
MRAPSQAFAVILESMKDPLGRDFAAMSSSLDNAASRPCALTHIKSISGKVQGKQAILENIQNPLNSAAMITALAL